MPTMLNTVNLPLETYIRRKIDMIQKEFYISLSEDDIARFYSLPSHVAVDQYAHYIFTR